jgi:hypothetical protein
MHFLAIIYAVLDVLGLPEQHPSTHSSPGMSQTTATSPFHLILSGEKTPFFSIRSDLFDPEDLPLYYGSDPASCPENNLYLLDQYISFVGQDTSFYPLPPGALQQ